MEETNFGDPAHDEFEEDRPSRALSFLMILVGTLFLLPFLFLTFADGPLVSPSTFVSAFLSVGWTFGLGLVFLLFGWKRLSKGTSGGET